MPWRYPAAAVNRPDADWRVDAEMVRAVVAAQAPEHLGPVRWIADGWDNEIFRVGKRLIARMPRRQVAVPLVENEHRWLPGFVELPLPIPRPVVRGAPSAFFPHPWSLFRYLEGEPATGRLLRDPASAAQTLGAFLRVLHREAPPEAPHNPFRSVPLHDRTERVEVNIGLLGEAIDGDAARAAWSELRNLEATGPRVWLHGDLHPSNVLVHEGTPSAVIDFGDLCAGDRACDLALAWMLFDGGDRGRFFDAAEADAPTRERSRGWALALSLAYAATADQDPPFGAMARRTIGRCTGAAP
jgi:aminoglycoside phosphotransferase (APT) family kinase protein